ncbi:hypothetical protein [Coxiella-like endosymbiont of Rhipicephalus sanguineus]|uniref:hypothetical protein n=1 Tax=Coxiella-like endosymbiont of Rhipicephalus sanguineus TaxID=1955402 RepID=UPI0020411707|nr:hypothetical protein [Coxiella-like endosymbiont of Rhipicephalus sanguineus]
MIPHSEDTGEKEQCLKQMQFKMKELCIQKLSQSEIKKLEPELNFRDGYFYLWKRTLIPAYFYKR